VKRHAGALIAILVGVSIGLAAGRSLGPAAAASLNLTSENLTPYRTCTLSATPATTTSIIDSNVRQASATTNFGATTTMLISSASAANQRIYIKFDLAACVPAIPSTAIVRLATMRLYATVLPAACRTVDIFRVTATWAEATITWNNQPFGTALNNPASGSRSGTYDIGTPAACQNSTANAYVVGATLTSDVAAFVAGSATNFGWMLRDDVESSATTRSSTYATKNLGTVGQVPQLVVTYVTVP
jgi:hypothetical protein